MNFQNLYAPEDFKNEWRQDLNSNEYHSDKNAVNSSSLKLILKSSLAFHNAFYGKPKEVTKPMKFGTLAHLAILQGSKFKENYVVMPEFESKTADGRHSDSKNTKYYKEQVLRWTASLPENAIVVTEEEREHLLGMVNSIIQNKDAKKLLTKGVAEIAGYWKHYETGISCRMQADFLSFNLSKLIDVKTTTSVSWLDFRRSVEALSYPFQLAMYSDGIKAITGKAPTDRFWIAIEKEPPYECAVYKLCPIYEQQGDHEFWLAMNELKKCIDEKSFPSKYEGAVLTEPSISYQNKYKINGENL